MTLDGYFTGCIAQLEARAREMLGTIPGQLARDYDGLTAAVEHRIREALQELRELREDPELLSPANGRVRLRKFKRIVTNLEHLERFALAPLSRSIGTDNQLNRLLDGVKRETGFPFPAPVVSPFSSAYFLTDPGLRVIAVPLLEGSFVLHLPDLYHELAHCLFPATDDPKLAAFVDSYVVICADVMDHFSEEIRRARLGFSPQALGPLLDLYRSSWTRYWLKEFYCDIFAAACLGPAYGWAHVFLTVKHVPDPFTTPVHRVSTHPPDHARMQVILDVLGRHGHADEVQRISGVWHELMSAQSHPREPEFDQAVPAKLRDGTVEQALAGLADIGCHFARAGAMPPIAQLLDEAWAAFLADPAGFPTREPDFRRRLMEQAAG